MTVIRAFTRCPCGHLFLHHDIAEYDGDGSDLCCVEGCDQASCPGRQAKIDLTNDLLVDTYVEIPEGSR